MAVACDGSTVNNDRASTQVESAGVSRVAHPRRCPAGMNEFPLSTVVVAAPGTEPLAVRAEASSHTLTPPGFPPPPGNYPPGPWSSRG